MPLNQSEFIERSVAFSKRFKDNPAKAVRQFIDNRKAGLDERNLEANAKKDAQKPLELLGTLETLAGYEKIGKTARLAYGLFLSERLQKDEDLDRICDATEKLLPKYPNSILLIFLRAVTLANRGQFVEAHDLVSRKMEQSQTQEYSATYSSAEIASHQISLGKIWRVIDASARDDMSWVNGQSSDNNGYDSIGFLRDIPKTGKLNISQELYFLEPYLQGKFNAKYIEGCIELFERSSNLKDRLKIISAILRTGLRRLPTYHTNFNIANQLFEDMKPEWLPYLLEKDALTPHALKSPKATTSNVRALLKVAQKLNRDQDVKEFAETLTVLGLSSAGKDQRWLIGRSLIEIDTEKYRSISKRIIQRDTAKPKKLGDIEHYLAWAQHAQDYTRAISFFEKQPSKYRRTRCGLIYVNLLQRVGRFADAYKIASSINAAFLVRPASLCPFTVWSTRRRVGELEFTAETASYYTLIPQPTKPKGVIFVTCRTIEQMRRTPIVILMEWKRLGWAVISLVEGVLPEEKTGIAALDQYSGCLALNRDPNFDKTSNFESLENFNVDLKNGSLTWNNIDMSHALWEEAAVNRRVYDVDYTCPILQQYLTNNVRWTEVCAFILKNLRQTMAELKLRTGLLIYFNHRLPDAVFRFYCEENGDKDDFFCLHSANGYQNYFANFSTNVSTKGIMRNMTRYPETRSGSFPVPSKLETYYEMHKADAPLILDMVKGVTEVKRSTEGLNEIPPEVKAAKQRILDWRAKGGKVACAFGKVVCDSAVPYDGGPAHKNMKDWINHTIEAVRDSNTLLLIKPHPHELKEQIACFINAYFSDLIEQDLPDNVMFLGHRWFDISALEEFVDLGLIYNGTTSIEFGLLNIPSVLCSYFAPVDYPIGHVTPKSREDYEKYVRFEQPAKVKKDLSHRAACWIHYMSGTELTKNYRYHSRQITNEAIYPPWWFKDDINAYIIKGDMNVTALAKSVI